LEKRKPARPKKSESAGGKVNTFFCLQLRQLEVVLQDATEGEKEKTKAERTKKPEVWTTGKSATMFSAWLSKPPVRPFTSESKPAKVAAPTVSDFESAFRPFALKKNIDLAPNNYFMKQAETKNASGKEVIELNDNGDLVDASAKRREMISTPYPKGTSPFSLPKQILNFL
jgi:hypothetical protein